MTHCISSLRIEVQGVLTQLTKDLIIAKRDDRALCAAIATPLPVQDREERRALSSTTRPMGVISVLLFVLVLSFVASRGAIFSSPRPVRRPVPQLGLPSPVEITNTSSHHTTRADTPFHASGVESRRPKGPRAGDRNAPYTLVTAADATDTPQAHATPSINATKVEVLVAVHPHRSITSVITLAKDAVGGLFSRFVAGPVGAVFGSLWRFVHHPLSRLFGDSE